MESLNVLTKIEGNGWFQLAARELDERFIVGWGRLAVARIARAHIFDTIVPFLLIGKCVL